LAYQPALIQLKPRIDPPRDLVILDQKSEGVCAGFGLAAVIHYLNQMRGRQELQVSAHMLYEIARKYDEWGARTMPARPCAARWDFWCRC
jgi:hypothetical protein